MKSILWGSLLLLFYGVVVSGCKDDSISGDSQTVESNPNWPAIKNNAAFTVPDKSYAEPYLQPLTVGGWEDGLYISRDGLQLFAYYMPVDVFSLYDDFKLDPECFNYEPYFRPPLLGVDMASNPWGCETFFQGDIIIAERDGLTQPFSQWSPSNLQRSISNEGAPCGVLRDDATFDVFVFTQNPGGTDDLDIMFLRNIPRNPTDEHARPIVGTSGAEDNPHIERLDDGSLLLIFDRDRYMYYSLSTDNGDTWSDPVLITNILNDQAPYDVQPHLWNDGSDWWVYFCADNEYGRRSIYRSKQETGGDWDSWGAPELVIAPDEVVGGYGTIIGVGEPTLTERGDISFVAVYGFLESADTTDVYDCDPWFLPRK